MKRSRFTKHQIISILKEAGAGPEMVAEELRNWLAQDLQHEAAAQQAGLSSASTRGDHAEENEKSYRNRPNDCLN